MSLKDKKQGQKGVSKMQIKPEVDVGLIAEIGQGNIPSFCDRPHSLVFDNAEEARRYKELLEKLMAVDEGR